LNEEVFALTYCMSGMTYTCVSEKMDSTERVWHLRRLREQIRMESEEVKKGAKSPKAPKRSRRSAR
jgi:hypothetical protein